jgi:sugar lactone lactonase YvrE
MLKVIVWLVVCLMFVIPVTAQDLPDEILIDVPNVSPEGIEWDAVGERFLISSMSEGTVFAVSDDGELTPFIEDDDLVSSIGLEIDYANNRLLVVNSDAGHSTDPAHDNTAMLGIYDLTTGERLHMVNLAELVPDFSRFPNDVAIDASGNAYVTDSLAPVIYRVEMDGSAEIFLQDERLLIAGFGGNGIVYHPDGYLLVGISGLELYKISVNDSSELTIVDTDRIVAADGMLWTAEGQLAVVSSDAVVLLESDDDWQIATTLERARNHPATTIALRGETVYALHPNFDSQSVIVRVW